MIKINNKKQEKEQAKRQISGLLNELAQLPAHPDRPNDTGPHLIKHNANLNIANDNDGMLGSLALESMLAPIFADITNGTIAEDLDLGAASEVYSEYTTDRIEGKGTLATTEHGQTTQALKVDFHEKAWNRYERAMPKRKKIESTLAALTKEIDMLYSPAEELKPHCFA